MREYFTYGSVRGATGNGGPYRDRQNGSLVWKHHDSRQISSKVALSS